MKSNQCIVMRILLLVFGILMSSHISFGQVQSNNRVLELRSESCEIDEHNFNVVMVDALGKLNESGFLIVIARPGKGDKSPSLSRKRLDAAKEWMGRAEFPTNRLILAEGERVSGSGRVEFYVGGALTHVILPRANQGLCTQCCQPPPRDRGRKRR